uniref:Amphiregulin n=1 Tax=Bubo bubo TaxID=30461 RepID=A0A8C0F6V1_BUBBB
MPWLSVNSVFFTGLCLNPCSFTQISYVAKCCSRSALLLFISSGAHSSSAHTAFDLHCTGLNGGRVVLKEIYLFSIARLSHLVLFSVEPVVKPKPTKRGGEKNANKSRRKKNKGKNKKKGTPCEMEYKNFCIHGECIYLEHLQMVTCKCHQDFFGERCGEQFMKTQRKNDVADYSKTVLVVVAVLLSSISFITVLIIVIVQGTQMGKEMLSVLNTVHAVQMEGTTIPA